MYGFSSESLFAILIIAVWFPDKFGVYVTWKVLELPFVTIFEFGCVLIEKSAEPEIVI